MKKIYSLMAGSFLLLICSILANQAYAQTTSMQSDHSFYLFIGTYAPADSKGIFVYRFNTTDGKASFVSAVSGIQNPSFLTLSPDHRFLYAVSETETHDNRGGQVYAYSFDQGTGTLHYINKQWSKGNDPCNISMDKTGKWLFVANYNGGSLSVFPVEADGSVGAAIQTIEHHGHGIQPQQTTAHIHCALPAPEGNDVFVTDLGLDRVYTYELDPATGKLSPGDPPYTEVTKGSGPRILSFSPGGKNLYLIQELGGELTVFKYQPGKLTTIQTLSNLPKDYQGKIWAADIHFSPDGRFLYAANRDDLNDVVLYAVDKATGKLTYVSRTPTEGKTPRYFTITPDGRFLIVGHQNSDEIVIFKRNAETGALTLTKQRIGVPHAVCLKMVPAP
ncbi:MAG TPA: lactonase family protein [Chitinophagaceae bacterium]|nr:lactonase family protein [Chitinophagaceae bacterium]